MVVQWFGPHLLFAQLQEVLPQTNRGQQRGAAQQQHVALLPLVAVPSRVLVAAAQPQASRHRAEARAADWRRRVGAQAAPQGPRVVHGTVAAGL